MKRVNSQSSSTTTTCKPSDSGTSHQLLHRAIWQHLSSVLFLLLSLGAGLGTATAQAQTSAYVTNTSGTVSVIDTATNTVVATILVGIFPSGGAITPDGTRAYVANIVNSISVIDTATNTVVDTIASGQFPTG
jgi:YVTN family beta-propeller protein